MSIIPITLLSLSHSSGICKSHRRHLKAFERALAMSDAGPSEGDLSPSSPRSPQMSIDERMSANFSWQNATGDLSDRGSERVKKLAATSDFAVSFFLSSGTYADYSRSTLGSQSKAGPMSMY